MFSTLTTDLYLQIIEFIDLRPYFAQKVIGIWYNDVFLTKLYFRISILLFAAISLISLTFCVLQPIGFYKWKNW